jgi:hypothetical protein
MPDMSPRRNFGYVPDLPDHNDWKYSALLSDSTILETAPPSLPERTLIRNLHKIPVVDQGNLGSCVGCSVASLHAYERGVVARSILQIYYEARRLRGWENYDTGAFIRDAIKVIANLGAGRSSWWAYDDGPDKFRQDPPLKVDRDALLRRIFSYWALEGREDYRTCLANGHPFVIGSNLFSNFGTQRAWDHGIIGMPSSRDWEWGGHAYLVIGSDTNFRESEWAQNRMMAGFPRDQIPWDVYICRNSWSSQWGYRGDFAVAAEFIDDLAYSDDAWTIRKIREPASAAVSA